MRVKILPANKTWISTFPEKEGWYWLYGYKYYDGEKGDMPNLHIMHVAKRNGEIVGVVGNHIVHPQDYDAYFCEATIPNTTMLFT